jgi:hypothetical protein
LSISAVLIVCATAVLPASVSANIKTKQEVNTFIIQFSFSTR